MSPPLDRNPNEAAPSVRRKRCGQVGHLATPDFDSLSKTTFLASVFVGDMSRTWDSLVPPGESELLDRPACSSSGRAFGLLHRHRDINQRTVGPAIGCGR